MLYTLISPILLENAIVDLTSSADRFHAFFLQGKSDDSFLQYTSIRFKAQEGYTLNNIKKSDYLESSIGVPIFSSVFADLLGMTIQRDIKLFPCEVLCQGELCKFYVGKILFYSDLVNPMTSDFRLLTDGRKVLRVPRYNTTNDEDFFIARDVLYTHLFAVSEKLVSLIKKQNLQIVCKPLL